MKRSLPFIIIGVVLVGAVATIFILSRKGNGAGEANTPFVASNQPTPNAVSAPVSAPSTGTASTPVSSPDSTGLKKPNVKISSPVVLEEYGDYQCPPCGALYPELKQIEGEYGQQLQIIFHFLPLTSIHKNALAAARAAVAARLQDKFQQMHDRLYRNQSAWVDLADPRPVFISYARELGLNVDQFQSDMQSNRVDQAIGADVQRARSLGINGTPTILIDGQQLRFEATNLDGIRRGINVVLEHKAVR